MWVKRLNSIFNLIVGFLGGMGLMNAFMLITQMEYDKFVETYPYISVLLVLVFQIITSIALVQGMALTSIYADIADEKVRNMDPEKQMYTH